MMRRLLYPLFTVLALLAVPAGANAAAPTIANQTSTNVYSFQTTVSADVTQNGGTSTGVQFRYGTASDLSGETTLTPATPISVTADGNYQTTITGLSPATQYYFRAESTNSDGTTIGTPNQTFTTSPVQLVTTGAFSNLTATTVTLAGTANPNGLATQARFRYGTSPNSQQFTPIQAAGSGTAAVPITASVTGLPAFTRIYYTLRTDRSAPVSEAAVEGPQLSFITDRALTGITAKVGRVTYNGTSTISGNVTGAGNSGVGIDVQADPYPYNGAYSTVLSGNTGANGAYSLRLAKNTRNTRIRVVTKGSSVVTSSLATLYVQPSVGLITKKQGSRRLLRGTIRPRLTSDSARAKIQRRVGRRWVTVKSLRLTSTSSASSKYSTTVGRRSKKTKYRVQVSPGTSAYATGTSRTRSFK